MTHSDHQFREVPPRLLALARRLRSDHTDAERLLWRLLRDRQVVGLKFRRQHSIAPYVLDFYCPDLRLAVEVDGGQHFEPRGERHDAERTRALDEHGIATIRFTNFEVLQQPQAVLETIWRSCDERSAELRSDS